MRQTHVLDAPNSRSIRTTDNHHRNHLTSALALARFVCHLRQHLYLLWLATLYLASPVVTHSHSLW